MVVREVERGTVVADRVDQARSFGERFRGLMGRPSLADGEGLYLPETSIHMMFMRFPIDAVFVGRPEGGLDAGARSVLSVHRGLRPWTGLVPLVRGASGVLDSETRHCAVWSPVPSWAPQLASTRRRPPRRARITAPPGSR